VWERIRRGFAMPDLDTKAAANSTRWYAAQPDYIGRMGSRAIPYLFHIVEEIEKRGLPTELALLPFVESAMQPEAESHAKAVGLWQFIPSTGKLYALEQNAWHDQRRGVVESTRAALDYLEKLYADFGDWHLALAAYNCGEGCIGRAVARNRAQKKPVAYSQLRLPRETMGYVPKLQAIKNIVRDPQRYAMELPAIENKPYFVALAKSRDIDVATAARLAEMSVDEFRALNPAFTRPVIVGATSPSILLPAEREATFLGNLAAWESTGQALASWTTYTLTGKETLAHVAERAGVSEAALREANRIPPRYKVAAGSTILIPRDETMDADIAPAALRASFAYVPENTNLRQITYRVRRGDTLAGVARRWNVSPENVVAWNNLRSQHLFAGQRLNLTVVARPAAPKARAASAASKKAAAPAATAAAASGTAARAAR
jgi:membrane-bound lytic murein transglycosylase D